MYARIATFEGDPANMGKAIEVVRGRIESNFESPPEGLEGVREAWMLVDREAGKGPGITLYETEEDRSRATKR
jgi:hypothetical protein